MDSGPAPAASELTMTVSSSDSAARCEASTDASCSSCRSASSSARSDSRQEIRSEARSHASNTEGVSWRSESSTPSKLAVACWLSRAAGQPRAWRRDRNRTRRIGIQDDVPSAALGSAVLAVVFKLGQQRRRRLGQGGKRAHCLAVQSFKPPSARVVFVLGLVSLIFSHFWQTTY